MNISKTQKSVIQIMRESQNADNNFNPDAVIANYKNWIKSIVSKPMENNDDNRNALDFIGSDSDAKEVLNKIKSALKEREFSLMSAVYDDKSDLSIYEYCHDMAGVHIEAIIKLDESDWDNEITKICIEFTAEAEELDEAVKVGSIEDKQTPSKILFDILIDSGKEAPGNILKDLISFLPEDTLYDFAVQYGYKDQALFGNC